MSDMQPKITIVEFTETGPSQIVPSERHIATLAARIGEVKAQRSVKRIKALLDLVPCVKDISIWADDSNVVRARVNEIEVAK